MKKTLLALTSALVLAGAMSSTASAQSRHDNHDNRNHNERSDSRDGRNHDERGDSRDGRYSDSRENRHDHRDNHDGRHDNGNHNGWNKKRYHAGRYMAPRNYSYRQYRVGSRLPMGYYGRSYYVDYGPYGLQAPPRGYRWNRVGNDVYLVNPTNGIIRDVIYSLFY